MGRNPSQNIPSASVVPPQMKRQAPPGHRNKAGCPNKPDFSVFEATSEISPEKVYIVMTILSDRAIAESKLYFKIVNYLKM